MRSRLAAGVLAFVALAMLAASAGLWIRAKHERAELEDRLLKIETSAQARLAEVRRSATKAEVPRAPAAADGSSGERDHAAADARLDAHDAEIAALRKDVGELRADIAGLRADLRNLRRESASLVPAPTATPGPNFAEMASRKGRGWGPEQATGEPDTTRAGDHQTAWASKNPDGGPESLVLTFDRVIDIASVRVFESYNPGAIIKVSAQRPDRSEVAIWEGQSSTSNPAPAVSTFECREAVRADVIVVDLDTSLVPGWNEIDAVAVDDTRGRTHWATSASASSSYADQDQNFTFTW